MHQNSVVDGARNMLCTHTSMHSMLSVLSKGTEYQTPEKIVKVLGQRFGIVRIVWTYLEFQLQRKIKSIFRIYTDLARTETNVSLQT